MVQGNLVPHGQVVAAVDDGFEVVAEVETLQGEKPQTHSFMLELCNTLRQE